ncbi:hypothetical protein R0K04_21130, partial [Pseudoalteromonas sp. SIMBA_153]
SREGTGNGVTTSAATRLAASGWLFIEDSLEQGARPWSGGGFGKVASCPEGWQAAMLDAVDRLSAGGAENLDRVGIFAAWEIERRAGGARSNSRRDTQARQAKRQNRPAKKAQTASSP